MTTLTEISELKAEMDAKFDRVYDQIAELQTDVKGLGEDVKAINGRLDTMDGKLDKLTANVGLLLKAQGIEGDEAAT